MLEPLWRDALLEGERKPFKHGVVETESAKSPPRDGDVDRDGVCLALLAGSLARVGEVGQQRAQPLSGCPGGLRAFADSQEDILGVFKVPETGEDEALNLVLFELLGLLEALVALFDRTEASKPQAGGMIGLWTAEQTSADAVVVADVEDREIAIAPMLMPVLPRAHSGARPLLERGAVERPRKTDRIGPDGDDPVKQVGQEIVEIGFPTAVVVAQEQQRFLVGGPAAGVEDGEDRPLGEVDRGQAKQSPGRDVREHRPVHQVGRGEHQPEREPTQKARLEEHQACHVIPNATVFAFRLPVEQHRVECRRLLPSRQPSPRQPHRQHGGPEHDEKSAFPRLSPDQPPEEGQWQHQ